jgi:glutamate dehydrogenase
VIDYYGDDEPIELGPDENMHDAMIEVIAEQAVKRGYVLGIGIMSSKRVGINHKQYGVTSRGVFKFSAIAMKQLGIDIYRDSFTVKITGGPNGDVAGNSMRLIIQNCPGARILCIIDASGALYDPAGADTAALDSIIHQGDIERFNVERLHPGGFILYSRQTRQEALKLLYRKVIRTASGFEESWVTADQFHRERDKLTFSASADLFLPCGGRPETIDGTNWQHLFRENGTPSVRVIVEGANSYLSPEARKYIQERGVIILRDSSANKCGVISSSYEIIGNLLMTEAEFLRHKEVYVSDVLKILDKRAEDEANLIFKRHQENGGRSPYTAISTAISDEINNHYDRLFPLFQGRPGLVEHQLSHRAILQHMPDFIRKNAKYKSRVAKLPFKIKCAILSSEIASSIVYHGGWDTDLESKLQSYLASRFNKRVKDL